MKNRTRTRILSVELLEERRVLNGTGLLTEVAPPPLAQTALVQTTELNPGGSAAASLGAATTLQETAGANPATTVEAAASWQPAVTSSLDTGQSPTASPGADTSWSTSTQSITAEAGLTESAILGGGASVGVDVSLDRFTALGGLLNPSTGTSLVGTADLISLARVSGSLSLSAAAGLGANPILGTSASLALDAPVTGSTTLSASTSLAVNAGLGGNSLLSGSVNLGAAAGVSGGNGLGLDAQLNGSVGPEGSGSFRARAGFSGSGTLNGQTTLGVAFDWCGNGSSRGTYGTGSGGWYGDIFGLGNSSNGWAGTGGTGLRSQDRLFRDDFFGFYAGSDNARFFRRGLLDGEEDAAAASLLSLDDAFAEADFLDLGDDAWLEDFVDVLSGDRPEVPGAEGLLVFEGSGGSDDDMGKLSPRASDLLADFLPFDLSSLELALQQFLSQLQDLCAELAGWLAMSGLAPWIVALAMAATACEIVRRWVQQSQAGQILALAGEGALSLWSFPDLADLLPQDA